MGNRYVPGVNAVAIGRPAVSRDCGGRRPFARWTRVAASGPRGPTASAAPLVEVRTSGIPGAGLGVFAVRDVGEGVRLTSYRGDAEPAEVAPPGGMTTLDAMAERCLARAREYSLELDDGRTLVGSCDSSDPSRAAQVVNDAGCVTVEGAMAAGAAAAIQGYLSAVVAGTNARLEVGGGCGDAVATRHISAGQEVLTAYSSPWWLAKVGAELQWRARRSAANGDPAGAQAAWELLEDLEMASGLYAGVELEALRSVGVITSSGAEAQFAPFARPPSPELEDGTPMANRLSLAAIQWKATSFPLRRRLIQKYGLGD